MINAIIISWLFLLPILIQALSLKPVLQALLVADHVFVDRDTGKHIIAGVFNATVVKQVKVTQNEEGDRLKVPAMKVAGSPTVYLSLTDVRGRQEFLLRYVFLNKNQAVFEGIIDVNCDNPLDTVEIAQQMPILPQEPGVYALELIWEEELLGSHRIRVIEKDGDNPQES